MPTAPPDVADGSALGDIAARGKRQLKMFIAQGDAKLESRTWLKTDHSDKPRVFHVSGPHINYDALTLDASVLGPGELLVRDEQIIANAPQSGDGSKPFSAKGTTLFRWKEHLQMKHGEGAMHDIEMLGGVEVRHRAIDGLISTVAARRLNATVERTGDATGPRNAAFDLGGMMELRRLKGAGGVYVHTKTRDVDCQEFDYDYASGDAMLSANPGRSVTILTTGSPHPLRAQRVIWNLITDKITATNPRGTAPR